MLLDMDSSDQDVVKTSINPIFVLPYSCNTPGSTFSCALHMSSVLKWKKKKILSTLPCYLVLFSNISVLLLGLSPSVYSGVVSKVVHAKMRLYTQSISQDAREFPAMLETTAAVHPGGSGGAVVNSSGHMIGLVTR